MAWTSTRTVSLIIVFLCLCQASLVTTQCPTEQHRPRYHFTATVSWLNDPNGLVYYDGVYHLFYQYHPYSKVWGPMHWGHAISRNLVTWEHLGIALYPDANGYIFSGSCVVDYKNSAEFKPPNGIFDPIVSIFTSAGERQSQSLAYSVDNGMTFEKYERNPVLVESDSPDFRDPKVFYRDNEWIMSLAVRNKIEFFSSPDLKNWTKQSEFGNTPPVGHHNGVWECPDLVPLNVDISNEVSMKLWVLIVSINPGAPNGGSATQYFIGNFTKDNSNQLAFQSYPWTNSQWIDWGPDNYAGVTFSNDPHGRIIYIGWMSNWDYAAYTPTSSWRGQMTVPRELSLRVLNHAEGQYRLVSTPIKELASLRNQFQYLAHLESFNMSPQTEIQLTEKADFKTPLMEIEISLEIENNPQFSICAYNSKEEEVCFGYDNMNWYLDRSKTGNINFHSKFSSALHATADREITDKDTTIKIFLDVSSIEVFADDGLTSMTGLHYPSEPFDRLYINHWSSDSSDATVRVKSYKIWGLQCSITDEETQTEEPSTSSTFKTYTTSSPVLINVSTYLLFRLYYDF